MKFKTIVISKLLCLSILTNSYAATRNEFINISLKTNKEAYEQAGTYEFTTYMNEQEIISKQAEMRKFIWEHWINHKLAMITAKYCTSEGDQTTKIYLIEPNIKGKWNINIFIQHDLSSSVKDKIMKPKNEYISFTKLFRMNIDEVGNISKDKLSDKVYINPHKYVLIFENYSNNKTGL